MTITTQFLFQCTDEQINKGVAWCRAGQLGFANPCEFLSRKSNNPEKQYFILTASDDWDFNPCTNPNDIMPIAFANEISLMRDWAKSSMYTAIGTRSEIRSLGEYKKPIEITIDNPLRAICECYILMSVSK